MRKIFLVFLLLLLTMPFMSIVTNSRTVEKPRKGLYCAFDTQMNMRYLQVFIDSDTTMCIGSRGTHMYAVATWKQYGDTILPKDSIGYENIDGKFVLTCDYDTLPYPSTFQENLCLIIENDSILSVDITSGEQFLFKNQKLKWRSYLITDFYEQITKIDEDDDDAPCIYPSYAHKNNENIHVTKKRQKTRIIFR